MVDCFIGGSLAHKRNAVAAPASSKRQLGCPFRPRWLTYRRTETRHVVSSPSLELFKECRNAVRTWNVLPQVEDSLTPEETHHAMPRVEERRAAQAQDDQVEPASTFANVLADRLRMKDNTFAE
jgi:hypothetical protein